MKNKLLIALLFLFIGFFGNAQAPTLIYSQKFSAFGSGASGVPTVNINIPAGKNRMMVMYVLMERVHIPTSSNWSCNPDGASDNVCDLDVYAGSALANTAASNNYYYTEINSSTDFDFSISRVIKYLGDADGLPTGNTSITFPNINFPEAGSDEMAVIVSVFENVKGFSSQLSHITTSDITTSTVASPSGTHIAIPAGRTISDIMYLGIGGISQQSGLTFSTGWTSPSATMSTIVSNTSGSYTPGSTERGEPDGISARMAYRTYPNTLTAPGFTLTRGTSTKIHNGHGYLYALIPLAQPSISGTVYNDTTGPSSINGTGVNAGGTYVNVIDADNKIVYSATVATNGSFAVPTGYVLERNTYRLELTKNIGTIGDDAPAKELPAGWETVGESLSTSGNDGTHDGTINLTVGAANITGLRYGIKTCVAPVITTPPSTATYCQNGTATALSVTATGTSLSYQWYRNNINGTSGATAVGTNSSTYTPDITATGTWYYYVVVTSGTCSTTSSFAKVDVTACCNAGTSQVPLNGTVITN